MSDTHLIRSVGATKFTRIDNVTLCPWLYFVGYPAFPKVMDINKILEILPHR